MNDKGQLYSIKARQLKRYARENIHNTELREWAIASIGTLPRAIFERDLSEGPLQYQKAGGLINHLLATGSLAATFAECIAPEDKVLRDLCLTAGIMHDIFVFGTKGTSEGPQENHPLYVGQYLGKGEVPVYVSAVLGIVAVHEGVDGPIETKTRSRTMAGIIVHLADRATMRPWIEIDVPMLRGAK